MKFFSHVILFLSCSPLAFGQMEGSMLRILDDLGLDIFDQYPVFYLAGHPSGSHVYVSGEYLDLLIVVSTSDVEDVRYVEIDRPVGMTLTPNGELYVVNQVGAGFDVSGTLFHVDPDTFAVTEIMDLPFQPSALVTWDNNTLMPVKTSAERSAEG